MIFFLAEKVRFILVSELDLLRQGKHIELCCRIS